MNPGFCLITLHRSSESVHVLMNVPLSNLKCRWDWKWRFLELDCDLWDTSWKIYFFFPKAIDLERCAPHFLNDWSAYLSTHILFYLWSILSEVLAHYDTYFVINYVFIGKGFYISSSFILMLILLKNNRSIHLRKCMPELAQ